MNLKTPQSKKWGGGTPKLDLNCAPSNLHPGAQTIELTALLPIRLFYRKKYGSRRLLEKIWLKIKKNGGALKGL